MKFNKVNAVISIAISGLISYFLSAYVEGPNKIYFGVGCVLTLTLTMAGVIALSFGYDRTTTLTRTVSTGFFLLTLIGHGIFCLFDDFLLRTYFMIIGMIALLYFLVVYNISRSQH